MKNPVQTVSEKETIADLWQNHWDRPDLVAANLVKGRYVQEAFSHLNAHIHPGHSKILEAGCGTGRLCALLARARPDSEIVGVDISNASIDLACKLKDALALSNLHFQRGDLFSLPYPDGHFDVVFNEGVIQHFREDGNPSWNDALREMIRVLKPGGQLIVAVVNWHCYPHTLNKWLLAKLGREYPYGYEKSFTKTELVQLLEEHGIAEIQAVAYFPAHGFYRLAPSSKLFQWLGRIVDLFETSRMANVFGFEMMAMGIKPLDIN